MYVKGELNASGDGKAFIFGFKGIPAEACIELVTKNWNNNLNVAALKIAVAGASTSNLYNTYLANWQRKGQIFCKADIPLNIDKATSICSSDNMVIAWKFY